MAKQILKIYEKKVDSADLGSRKYANYLLTQNQYLNTNKERFLTTLSYLFEKGVGFINVMYFAGYDGLELDVNHPYDVIYPDTSKEEFKEILDRASKNAFPRFIAGVCIDGEPVMLDIMSDGKILAQLSELHPKIDNAAWRLEEYFC